MKKFFTSSVAALVAVGTVAGTVAATPAMAEPHHGSHGRGDHGRGDNDGRWERGQGRDRDDHRDRAYSHRGNRDWGHRQGDRRNWNGNHRWQYYGGNYGYRGYAGNWRSGQRYPYWQDRRYYVTNYSYYGLPAPRHGYRYYRDDNGDIVMAAIGSGIIGLIIGGALAGR